MKGLSYKAKMRLLLLFIHSLSASVGHGFTTLEIHLDLQKSYANLRRLKGTFLVTPWPDYPFR